MQPQKLGIEAIGQRYYYNKAKPSNMQLLQTVIQNENITLLNIFLTFPWAI